MIVAVPAITQYGAHFLHNLLLFTTLKQSVVRFPEALSLKLRISSGVINSKKSPVVSPPADQKRSQYASVCPATSLIKNHVHVTSSTIVTESLMLCKDDLPKVIAYLFIIGQVLYRFFKHRLTIYSTHRYNYLCKELAIR